MKILAHRGAWNTVDEKNTVIALERAHLAGFGLETDFRDHGGHLVVQHDVPRSDDNPVSFLDAFINIRPCINRPLAVNIKADGLDELLRGAFAGWAEGAWFCFDASIPDAIRLINAGIPYFHRLSEYECWSPLHRNGQGIWVDELTRSWLTAGEVDKITQLTRNICFVSSELHGRDHTALWELLYERALRRPDVNWMLCTDKPEEARRFFYE